MSTEIYARVEKAKFIKLLGAFSYVDSVGVTPYIGVKVEEEDVVHLYRSGVNGHVCSSDAPSLDEKGWVFPSFSYLSECLRYIQGKIVRIYNRSGFLHLVEEDDNFETDIRLHSVPRDRTGIKQHPESTSVEDLSPTIFGSFDYRGFSFSAPPTLQNGGLFIVTPDGVVTYTTNLPPTSSIKKSPRESFLKAISGEELETLTLDDHGYFEAKLNGYRVFTSGHNVTFPGLASGKEDKEKDQYSATRFISVMKTACQIGHNVITLDPATGVTGADQFGNPFRLSLGGGEFHTFKMTKKAAKLVHDALVQDKNEIVTISKVTGKYRMTRGDVSVTLGSNA